MFMHKSLMYDLQVLDAVGIDENVLKYLEQEINLAWDVSFNEKRIKISIPNFLPAVYIKTIDKAAGYFSNEWKMNTVKSIRNFEEISNLKYEKVFCLV